MRISERVAGMSSSPTLTLNDKARTLKISGKPIINLGIGEPLNPTPENAVDFTARRLNTRQIKYAPTAGTPELKSAILDYTKKYYGRAAESENVLVTVGAKQALFNIMMSLLDPGDEAILLAPYWVSYPEMIKMAHGIPVIVQPRQNLLPEVDDIWSAVTSRTRLILLNSPNNPSGVTAPPDFIASLVRKCEEENMTLVMDDIYHLLTYEGHKWIPAFQFTSRSIDESPLVIVNGVSKTYGMTGFRIGWVVAPRPLVRAMTRIQGQTTSGASILLQDGALGALLDSQRDIHDLQDLMRGNRSLMLNELKTIPDINIPEPGGAFYVFPDFSAYSNNSVELAQFILEKAYVVTIPGSAFGMEGHLRLSYTGSPSEIKESIQRIRWAIDKTSPDTITMQGESFQRSW